MRNRPQVIKSFKTKLMANDWICMMEMAEKKGSYKSAMKGRQFVMWNLVTTPALYIYIYKTF